MTNVVPFENYKVTEALYAFADLRGFSTWAKNYPDEIKKLLEIMRDSGFILSEIDELIEFVPQVQRKTNGRKGKRQVNPSVKHIVDKIEEYRRTTRQDVKFTVNKDEIKRSFNRIRRRLRGVGPMVTMMGSHRGTVVKTKEDEIDYSEIAQDAATRLSNRGLSILQTSSTGSGKYVKGGFNEATNTLSRLIYLGDLKDFDEDDIEPDVALEVFHQFIRKTVITTYSDQGIVLFPGGLGTLDVFFETITLLSL